jgi:hypothetical protein
VRLTPEERLRIFGTDKYGGEWANEAAQRWGSTNLYQESQRRTSTYSKADWVQLKAEADEGVHAFADAKFSGAPATSPAAMALAEQHRDYICRWFYDCSHEVHRDLAQMYVSDDRFTALYETAARGLAQYVHDAILANADAHS